MIYSKITGTGSYLPEKILSNHDLEKMFETTDEWITTRTGIKERHIVSAHQYTSDLAVEASKLAISAASIDANKIDLIIVATTTLIKHSRVQPVLFKQSLAYLCAQHLIFKQYVAVLFMHFLLQIILLKQALQNVC